MIKYTFRFSFPSASFHGAVLNSPSLPTSADFPEAAFERALPAILLNIDLWEIELTPVASSKKFFSLMEFRVRVNGCTDGSAFAKPTMRFHRLMTSRVRTPRSKDAIVVDATTCVKLYTLSSPPLSSEP